MINILHSVFITLQAGAWRFLLIYSAPTCCVFDGEKNKRTNKILIQGRAGWWEDHMQITGLNSAIGSQAIHVEGQCHAPGSPQS